MLMIENYGNSDDFLPINEIISLETGSRAFIKLTENEVSKLSTYYLNNQVLPIENLLVLSTGV